MSFGKTLGAVAIGGLISLAAQLIVEANRRRLDRTISKEQDRQANRMAARLVLLDLLSIISLLEGTAETDRWWTALQLPIGAWQMQAELLSRSLPDSTWRLVGSTFSGAAYWNNIVGASRRYYWVMPRIPLRRFGLEEMRSTLLSGAKESIESLISVAMPTAEPDDPLYRRVRNPSPE